MPARVDVPGPHVVGVLLAAGAGRRFGGPKALVTAPDGSSWAAATARRLTHAGCAPVRVVLGAGAEEASALLDGEDVELVFAADWADGMSASLRAGLTELAVAAPDAEAALFHLVDLPDVGTDVLRRLLALAPDGGAGVLARATYDGAPGHPVLLGREHWDAVAESVHGDRGARDYLIAHDATNVECGDLASGQDVDR